MTTIDTTVEKDLKDLKDAVSAVVKANDAWLSALESFFEGIVDTTKQFLKDQLVSRPNPSDKNFYKLKGKIGQLASDADSARNDSTNGLSIQVDQLLTQASVSTTVVALPPTELTGVDLLLGGKLDPCSEFFLRLITA